eukprot:5261472-Alexandrium_andersonii.AAC.1
MRPSIIPCPALQTSRSCPCPPPLEGEHLRKQLPKARRRAAGLDGLLHGHLRHLPPSAWDHLAEVLRE